MLLIVIMGAALWFSSGSTFFLENKLLNRFFGDNMIIPKLMGLKTAAQYSGLSREKLEKAIADGELYAIKENGIGKGGKTIIGVKHLDEYLERILSLEIEGYQPATKAKINAKPEANEAEEEFDAYAIAMLRAKNPQFNKLCNLKAN